MFALTALVKGGEFHIFIAHSSYHHYFACIEIPHIHDSKREWGARSQQAYKDGIIPPTDCVEDECVAAESLFADTISVLEKV